MKNIYIEQPEFIDEDPRKHRPDGLGYQASPEFMMRRHEILLPREIIEGKTVLDLGSCLAASGAWCLSNGAAFYKGVEIQEEFVDKSRQCLEKYYSKSMWDVEAVSIEDFLSKNTVKFDVIFASGILYGIDDPLTVLKKMASQSDCIVLESRHLDTPFHSRVLSKRTKMALKKDKHIIEHIENASYMYVGTSAMVAPGDKNLFFHGLSPSMGALKYILRSLGFEYHDNVNQELKKHLSGTYNPIRRFGMLFTKNPELTSREWGLAKAVEDSSNIIKEMDWNQST